jgi:8-oxo-dGTP pyrophosphatase MutT (NUDIX family)
LIEKLAKSDDSRYYVAVVPVNSFGEVLVGKRTEDGIWTTPGGGSESNETPREVAVRECWQEAGLKVYKDALELLDVVLAPNGKPVYRYLFRTNQPDTTSRLDPDKEVKEWNWVEPGKLSKEFSREKNKNRLDTVNEALMRYYGLTKSNKTMEQLIEKLGKGGPGSGIQGHTTPKQRLHARLAARGIPKEKMHLYTDKQHQSETSIGRDALGNELRPGQERHRAYAGQPQTRDSIARDKRKKELAKKLNKSVTQMGGSLGDPDVNTSEFAQAQNNLNHSVLQRFYKEMENFEFGDMPRQIELDKGILHLSKVDDGMYSGYFTRRDGELLDNARVRIDKMNLPDVVGLVSAKEWVRQSPLVQELPKPEESKPQILEPEQKNFNEMSMPMALAQPEPLPTSAEPLPLEPLIKPPEVPPMQSSPGPQEDRTLAILRLVAKLVHG